MIITALDYKSGSDALEFVAKVDPSLTKLKVGKELFTRAGPALVEQLQAKGFDVFLDLKFHDIPNTVAGALSAAASLGVWMVNVHAFGGPKMLAAARKAIPKAGDVNGTRLIAVTVLTSMDDAELKYVGVQNRAQEQVKILAQLSIDEGLDGVVCSAHEATLIRDMAPSSFLTVTPGVRPSSAQVSNDDQSRVMTPADAIKAGSRYLVIGRPITQSKDPLASLQQIHEQISSRPKIPRYTFLLSN
ncbi:UNVERIFIED_CONTAM: hypothetical protein GTU68_026654 [Idotea baltica]|nr:hypothetical protein [Idotea baltica]